MNKIILLLFLIDSEYCLYHLGEQIVERLMQQQQLQQLLMSFVVVFVLFDDPNAFFQ
jgi:hypothetical protein